jgi:hypothetical protein
VPLPDALDADPDGAVPLPDALDADPDDAVALPDAPDADPVCAGWTTGQPLTLHVAGTGIPDPRVRSVVLRTFPAGPSTIRWPNACPYDNREEIGAARATHPLAGAMVSVDPSTNDAFTSFTPDPAWAVTTATGSPSAEPTTLVCTEATEFAEGCPAVRAATEPTIWSVDTSTWNCGGPTTHGEAAAAPGKLVKKPRMVTPPALRVNRWV